MIEPVVLFTDGALLLTVIAPLVATDASDVLPDTLRLPDAAILLIVVLPNTANVPVVVAFTNVVAPLTFNVFPITAVPVVAIFDK